MSLLRCTATSQALKDLAEALLSDGIGEFHSHIATYDSRAGAHLAKHTHVEVDLTGCPAFSIGIASEDQLTISEGLQRLADEPDHSRFSLAELGLLSRESSRNDLEFFRLDTVPSLAQDYDPDISGSTWEGVLYHPLPTLKQFQRVREAVIQWAIPTKDTHEHDVFAVAESECRLDTDRALGRLVDPSDPTHRITIYFEHPLVVRYASPHTGAQVWLTKDCSEVIVSEHCIASGDFEIDVENFFSFRSLLVELSKSLNATRVAWGEVADQWPIEQAASPETLNDSTEMWSVFQLGLLPCIGSAELPASLESRFLSRMKIPSA